MQSISALAESFTLQSLYSFLPERKSEDRESFNQATRDGISITIFIWPLAGDTAPLPKPNKARQNRPLNAAAAR